MRVEFLTISVLFVAMSLYGSARAEGAQSWQKVSSKKGVTSWKREEPGRVFPLVRGEVEIAASLDVVRATIEDWKQHVKWMHRCAEVVQLQRYSETESLLYNRTDSPWPVKDRDVVFRLKRQKLAGDDEVLISFASEQSALKPLRDGVVRMPRLNGSYHLTRVGPRVTKVLYEVDADVGGHLPDWFVKNLVEEMPYETLLRLRAHIIDRES